MGESKKFSFVYLIVWDMGKIIKYQGHSYKKKFLI